MKQNINYLGSLASRPLIFGDSRLVSASKAEDEPMRIKKELREAGVTRYGLIKTESRYLPQIIRPKEHIKGTVYGRDADGSAMLVATTDRLIFIDKKPLFVKVDEIAYDVVSGVSYGKIGPFASLTLHTRTGDYKLSYANAACARRFANYIDSHCLTASLGRQGDI